MITRNNSVIAVAIAGILTVCPTLGTGQNVPGDLNSLRGLRTVAIDVLGGGPIDSHLQANLLKAAVAALEQAGLRVVGAEAQQASIPVLVMAIDVIPGMPPSVNASLQLQTSLRSASPAMPDHLAVWFCQESANGDLLQEARPLANRLVARFISAWEQANR